MEIGIRCAHTFAPSLDSRIVRSTFFSSAVPVSGAAMAPCARDTIIIYFFSLFFSSQWVRAARGTSDCRTLSAMTSKRLEICLFVYANHRTIDDDVQCSACFSEKCWKTRRVSLLMLSARLKTNSDLICLLFLHRLRLYIRKKTNVLRYFLIKHTAQQKQVVV